MTLRGCIFHRVFYIGPIFHYKRMNDLKPRSLSSQCMALPSLCLAVAKPDAAYFSAAVIARNKR